MPKPAPFTPKPSIEKLPLAVRKDVRDRFESKKAEFMSNIADLLGFPITINIDVNAVWAYADPSASATSAGSIFAGYIEGFISALSSYVSKYGDLGKEYFKNAVHKSELTVTVNELGESAETITAEIKDGVFRILFRQNALGYNQSYLYDVFAQAVSDAPHEGFSLFAKHSIETEYKTEIEDVHKVISEILNLPGLILEPNFEANYAGLLKKADQDWQRSFGRATLAYFQDGLKSQLDSQGFKGDDMLQEGFLEGIPSKTIKLRIVDKTKNGYANEVAIEDGVLYLQTTADRWWTNVYEAGSGVLDLL